MKNMQAFMLAVGVAILAVSSSAWAQTSEAASAPAMASSASAAPATGRKADRALRKRVYAAIAKQKDISAGNISVVAKDGVVTLNGSVTDNSQVGRVAEIAKGVSGVTSVTNKLSVQKPLGGM